MVQLLLPIIYISFISLGLPDSLLGSAWPSMYPALGVPVSYAGLISMIISFGTIVSSLNSDRLIRALGTGKVTALSVAMTAAALFGFSVSTQFWMLCLWAVASTSRCSQIRKYPRQSGAKTNSSGRATDIEVIGSPW